MNASSYRKYSILADRLIIFLAFLSISLTARGYSRENDNEETMSRDHNTIVPDFSLAPLPPAPSITLYTYQSGSWNNSDVWTTDPGGTTLVGSKIPEDGDSIVILPSRTITLQGNIINSGLDITIEEGGILDNAGFQFTQILSSFSGKGTLKLKSVNFPVSTLNTFVNSGGGTVEYYYNEADHNLPVTQTTYNNLIINLGGSRRAIQTGNISINGDLKIQNGTFQINDGSVNRLSLAVYGDVTVYAGASVTVGAGNTTTTTDPTSIGNGGTAPFLDYYITQSHRIEIYGNFTNNGTVKLTNQSYPVFNIFPTSGIASVFFRGAADNTLTCNGTTDFYNLIIDKGSDQTFNLTVNSAGYDKFRIFGANNASEFAGSDASNPNLRKALWIRTGTLKLNGYVIIPSLVEGAASGSGDFYIPGKGALILDGPDVVVMGTIDDYSAVNLAYGVSGGTGAVNGVTTEPSVVPSSLSLYGKIQVNDGNLYIGEIGRIIYYGTPTAEFVINGGTIDVKQFQSVSGGGKTAYWQTGGNLVLRGRFKRTLLYSSLANMIASMGNISQLNTARATYGGGNPLGTNPDVGTLNIDQDANVFHMENGNISIFDVSGSTGTPRAIEINSDPANIDVSGGNITLYITSGTILSDANYGIASKAPLYNLTIARNSGTQSASLLAIPAKSGVTGIASPPLTVLNNLVLSDATVSTNAVLDAMNMDVKVGGNLDIQTNAEYTPGTNRTILNGVSSQTVTNSGTITSGLYRFYIDKNNGTATLQSNLTVRDSLAIYRGTLNDGGFTLSVGGHVFNAGTHTGTGKIQLNGTALQHLSADMYSGTPSFGNLEVTNSSGVNGTTAVALQSDFKVNSLTLTSNRVFSIASYCLTVGQGGISAGLTYSLTRMIETNGYSSDGGLKRYIDDSYNNQTILFPVGCPGGVRATALAFFPGRVVLGTVSANGYCTVVPVSGYHPSCDPSKQNSALDFYWKTITSDLVTSGTRHLEFDYRVNINNSYNDPYYLLSGSNTWGTASGNNNSPTLILPTSIGIPSGDFTSGKSSPFRNPATYYSRTSGAWNASSGGNYTTWSLTGHNGAAVPVSAGLPQNYDNVIIGGIAGSRNDSVTITSNGVTAAIITINASYTSNNRMPVLNIANTTGHTIDIIRGAGKFCTSTANIPDSPTDYGSFLNNDTAVFNYYGATYTLPASITAYPNLLITGGNTKYLNTTSIVVRKNLIISDDANPNNALSLNSTSGDLTVNGDVQFSNGGKLLIPASAIMRNINIYGDINFKYGNTNNTNAIEAVSGSGITHKLNFYGDTIFSGASNLTFNPSNTNKIDLYIKDQGNTAITEGTGTFNLNKLYIQKDFPADIVYFKNNFTLNETGNNTSVKSLNLLSGTLSLSDPANVSGSTINLNLSSGGTNNFIINSSSKLILRNGSKVYITGNTAGSGIRLDGLLQANEASQINLADGGAANTGYIEYSGSGNAIINLSGSSVLKAAQLRRSLLLTTGLISYSQSGSSATTIYGLGTAGIIDISRAKFEVTGTGSVFNMSETSSLSIINGGGTSFGDLYLRPGSSSVTGGDIIFGTGVGGNSFKIDANVPINNLAVSSTGTPNTLQLMVNPLILNGNMILDNTGSTLITNNIDVTIKGNFTNNGIYNAGLNTTIFSGATQTIGGTSSPAFWNLNISPSVKLSLGLDISVNGALEITGGTLETTIYNVTANGNITNNGTYTNSLSPVTSRLYLNGTSVQHIAGTGSFGRIELNNNSGAKLDNNIELSEDIELTNGILDINQYLLTLGSGSEITGSGFGISKMIKVDGVLSNSGIKKFFSGGYTGTFVYPIGVSSKYTPATIAINSTSSGFVGIKAIASRHPATLSPYNVLNYYWEAESNISGFEGSIRLEYNVTDVTGNEDQYVAARLIMPPGSSWSKAAPGSATDNVDETTHTISFDFPAGTNNLGGQYTAGYDSDLPTTIPVYTSNVASGNWETPESWLPLAPPGGPNGFSVIINPGNTIYTNGNKRFAYKTTINGVLDVGTTYGHNLGSVDGTGKLSLQEAILPAGLFNSFLSCSGGTLEYGGTTSYTIIADRIDTVRNLLFIGTGTRTLPDKDLVICGQLEINGPTLDNSVYNKKLTIGGTFDLTSGIFISGTGSGATVKFKGLSAQTVSGFNLAGSSAFNNLEIDNTAGLTLNSLIEINGNLLLTNGVITSSSANKLKMINQSSTTLVIPEGGNSASFVNGPMSKYLFGGNNFSFPSGKATRYGKLRLINVQTGTWETEYFNIAYSDLSVTGTLSQPSSTEYWRVTSPQNGKTATVQIRWDGQSDINPATTAGGINDIRVAEFNGADWIEKSSATPVGNNTNGTVQTIANISINNTGDPQYYTLGSVSTVKPSIILSPIPVVCTGITSASLPYTATAGGPNQYTIDFDAAANAEGFVDVTVWTALPASPILISVPYGVAPGTYNGSVFVRASGTPANISIAYPFTIFISISPAPITGTFNVCAGSTTTLSNATPGGAWSSAAPAIATISNGGVVTGFTAGTSVISYTVAGCAATALVTVSSMTWTGAVNSDWNIPGNWSCGFVPDANTAVQIPNVPNKPLLTTGSTGSANNIVIDPGASLTVTGNTIQISGSITNNGIFNATDGIIEMNGSIPQTIGANVFETNTIKDLIINNAAGISLSGPLNITGILTLQTGDLSSGGFLTLVSTAVQTALIAGSGNGNVTGNVTMQRYLPSAFGYKYFSSPFQSSTVNEFADDMNLGSAFTTFYRYDENRLVSGIPVSGWVNYKTTTNVLNPLAGYAVNFGSSPASSTVDVSGVVNNGNLSVNLYNNNNPYTLGFNLIGNPYPSPIDWNAATGWTKTNIDNALYYFRASTTDEYGGTYSTYINGISSDGIVSNTIPSMQGFFIHVTDGTWPVTGTLAMDNRIRITDLTHSFTKSKGSNALPLIRLSALFADDANSSDNAVLYLDEKAQAGFDGQLDALKLFNTDLNIPNLYSFDSDGKRLSINALPPGFEDNYLIPLGLKLNRTGNVIFRISDIGEPLKGINISITDTVAGIRQDLMNENIYSLDLLNGEYNNRFFININKVTTGINDNPVKLEIFSIYSSDGILKTEINSLPGKDGTLMVCNILGQIIYSARVYGTGYYEFSPSLKEGIYIVSFRSGTTLRSTKIIIDKK